MLSREAQALMEAAVDGIVVVDHRGTMTAVNDAARRMFGYRTDEMLGENVRLLMPDPDRSAHDGYMSRYLSTGVPHVIGKGRDVIARRKSGECFPAHLTLGPVPGCAPPQFVGFVRDNSANVRRDEETRRSRDRMASVARLTTLGEMAAGIAHELNQPLTAINVYARACERFMDGSRTDYAELRAAVRGISFEVLRAGDIIRRVRQLVRSDPGEPARVDVQSLIVDLEVLIAADAREQDTQIRYRLESGGARVMADATQLQHLILNLVRNALEALSTQPRGSGVVEIAAHAVDDRQVEIAVTDNGPGVSPAVIDRLFDPFYTTKPGGTGLGLATSRKIAQAHGGTLAYRPVAPHGACFAIRLPAWEDPLP